jgi:DNA-directed RNA polymerase specialized sigma24 family protein
MHWFTVVYAEHRDAVLSTVGRRWPRLDAAQIEDAVAEACVDVLRRDAYWTDVRDSGGDRDVVALLVWTASCVLRRQYKRQSPVLMDCLEATAGCVSGIESAVDARLQLERLEEAAVDAAPGVSRKSQDALVEALRLRLYAGLNNAEASRAAGVPREYVSRAMSTIVRRERCAA